jgi:hypothetical protein
LGLFACVAGPGRSGGGEDEGGDSGVIRLAGQLQAYSCRVGGFGIAGPRAEDAVTQGGHPGVAESGPLSRRGRGVRRPRGRDKVFVDAGGAFVFWEFGEHAEPRRMDGRLGGFVDGVHTLAAFEKAVEPGEGADVQRLHVLVRTLGDLQADLVLRAEQRIDPPRTAIDVIDAVEWKDVVLVGVQDEQWARRDQGGHAVEVPLENVVHEHAVAMPLDASVDHVIAQAGDAGGGGGGLDAFIHGGDPPGVGAAAAAAGHAEALAIDLGAGLEVVEGADAIPCLHAGRGEPAAGPPPAAEPVGAVVVADQFTPLHGVDDEADVTMAGEPHAVVVVRRFVAQADPVFLDVGMPADVEDGRQFAVDDLRAVQVGREVQPRHGLEVEVFDHVAIALDGAGDHRLEVGARGFGMQAEHFLQLGAQPAAGCLPVGAGGDGAVERLRLNGCDLAFKERAQAAVGIRFAGQGPLRFDLGVARDGQQTA